MQNLVRRAFDEQRRFPIKVVNMLSQEFSSHGLQFFKRKKSVTHVSVSRPHHLDLENTPVSESIRDIVSFIIDTENCTRRNVLEKFAPEPEAPEASGEGDEKRMRRFHPSAPLCLATCTGSCIRVTSSSTPTARWKWLPSRSHLSRKRRSPSRRKKRKTLLRKRPRPNDSGRAGSRGSGGDRRDLG